MHLSPSDISGYVVVVALAILVVVLAVALGKRARSKALERRYGREYERTLNISGNRPQAERDLRQREEHVRKMHITELPNSAKFRYAAQWRTVQGRFVDAPREAVIHAERLLESVMHDRGYTSDSFEGRVRDLSPTYPALLESFRNAHAVALRATEKGVTTEELRRALVDYRSIFNELVGMPEPVS